MVPGDRAFDRGGFSCFCRAVLGVKIRNVFLKKNRVGFGRTELSLRLSWTELCALSSGHGPRKQGFQGGSSRVDFCIFVGSGTGGVRSDKFWKVFLKKTRVGFGRTELSLRLSCTEFCALSSGHDGSRGQGFEGGEETLDFCNFLGVKNGKNIKSRMNMVRFWSPELSTLAKWSPNKSRKFPGFSVQQIKF